MRTLLLVAVAAGCSTTATSPARPMGAHDHLAEAARHDADAARLEARAAERAVTPQQPPYFCGDQALADQVTTGGQKLGVIAPCWRGEGQAIERYRARAAHLRADAREHRRTARALVMAERAWCAGLPADELDHSPFDHREDLAAVNAELDGDRVRGARIRFAPVPGLSADWMTQTLGCHQAIAAAAGHDVHHLATCPVSLPGAAVRVVDDPAGLLVIVRSDDPATALTIYARAEALLRPDPIDGEPMD